MASVKESVLTAAQVDSMSIDRLIFHVINVDAEGDDRVIELDEIQLDDDQRTFFLDRIKSVAKGIQYDFLERGVGTKQLCEQLVAKHDSFVEASVDLTTNFANHHRKSMASGVFVVATVTIQYAEKAPLTLVFLAKFDHRSVYQIIVQAKLDGTGQHAAMTKVANTLVEDKNAIQKSALVDISDKFAWGVLADERKLRPNGEVTDYFKNFLAVQLREVASVLTRRAVSKVREWARGIPEADMLETELRGNYGYRAVAYMNATAQGFFDLDTFIGAIVHDADDPREADDAELARANAGRKRTLEDSLRMWLIDAGLENQKFQPKPKSLAKADRKQQWKTAEGVSLEFQGEPKDFGITVGDRKDGLPGQLIQILTQNISTT